VKSARLRILALVTDAFGGYGGMAKFNRDLLEGLSADSDVSEVVAVPRLIPNDYDRLPEKLTYVTEAIGGKVRYVRSVLRIVREKGPFDLIICGHINLVPLASVCRRLANAHLCLIIHGIDAWEPGNYLTNRLVKRIDSFVSVSALTRDRFLAWTGIDRAKAHLLPNCVDISDFGPGPKPPYLVERYGLTGKKVVMTFGRLDSREQLKGFDQILEALPELAREVPDIAYLIVGDGDDRKRLERKAKKLGVTPQTVFAGRISEEEKADHYRLADVYTMPSRGEGFGIVLLEAMASGVPVIASAADGSREALLDGKLGLLVDPGDKNQLKAAIIGSLQTARKGIIDGLGHYSREAFRERLHSIIAGLTAVHTPERIAKHPVSPMQPIRKTGDNVRTDY